jgi:hypothetical protein
LVNPLAERERGAERLLEQMAEEAKLETVERRVVSGSPPSGLRSWLTKSTRRTSWSARAALAPSRLPSSEASQRKPDRRRVLAVPPRREGVVKHPLAHIRAYCDQPQAILICSSRSAFVSVAVTVALVGIVFVHYERRR